MKTFAQTERRRAGGKVLAEVPIEACVSLNRPPQQLSGSVVSVEVVTKRRAARPNNRTGQRRA